MGGGHNLAVWGQDNNIYLNVIKTKEKIVDYRKRRAEHAHILIDRAVVEQVESFKFLGVHIINKLSSSKHTKTVMKRARQNLFSLRRLKRFGMVPQILKRFYSCTIKSILTGCITAWYATARLPTRRHYRGQCERPSTSPGPSFLPSRTSLPGVRRRP